MTTQKNVQIISYDKSCHVISKNENKSDNSIANIRLSVQNDQRVSGKKK